jgi:hypothetical protein
MTFTATPEDHDRGKVIRDGKVAVLVSYGWGAGWYTHSYNQEHLFNPTIVEMVLNRAEVEDIIATAEKIWGSDDYFGGADGLNVEWVDQGTRFIIEEYDGAEIIKLIDEIKWIIP